AAAMKRIFTWDSLEEWLRAGPRMHTLQGVARTVVQSLEFDREADRFAMEVVWHDSGEAEEHLTEIGPAKEPVCWMLVGYASGYASFCMDKEVYFIEQKCRAMGDRACVAVGKDAASWGDALKPHLRYFQSDDIRGKILQLTRELRKKDRELARQRRRLEEAGSDAAGLIEVHSPAFAKAVDLATRVAPYDTSVLITGESGVGKEVLARYIHRRSHRANGPFVAVNCAALPETLLESELFGHKAGSFTGAIRDRVGLFEGASGGTLFLDEVGDISGTLQMKLLRALQEREIMRVGESRPRKVDVRVIAATNRDLVQAMREGKFRDELYYRLRVIEIEIPPLRARQEDILPLTRHFVERFARTLKKPDVQLDAACVDYLQAYAWPGNVRELENAIERAVVLCPDNVIRPEYLPAAVLHPGLGEPGVVSAARTLEDVEYEHIGRMLKLTGGNKARAAGILGISPATLWRKLKKRPS
ncbi:MAG: sigma 54-interacting transcriptional regulator, partial [Kiritimatiellae bacterium]|nr:sigma 54-interacting transcriptional regulator [Kiritimatiellia bacterium]